MRIAPVARLLLIIAAATTSLGAQQPSLAASDMRLFLIERPVGVERAIVTAADGAQTMTTEMELVERGTTLELAATLTVGSDFTARHFKAAGRSYRFVNVDTEVTVTGATARVTSLGETREVAVPEAFFPARSWAPVAARGWLIAYWEHHKRPTSITLLPGDHDSRIVVQDRGEDEVQVGGRSLRLRRYSVDGVVWGRETVWIDESGACVALVSRVHILPLEAVRADMVHLLPQLQASAVSDRMADLAAFNQDVRPVAEGTFALIGGRIVTGTDAPTIVDGTVLVRDGRIAAVGPRESVAVGGDVRRVDVTGKTVIAGLWDVHAHASQIEWAPAYLAAGVTTIRDMGGEERFLTAFRDSTASGRGLGPRVLLAGLVDGPGAGGFGTVTASTAAEGRQVADHYADAGFHQVKLYSLLQPDVVKAITARAHERGLSVTGHVPSALGLEAAVLAGMDQVAHLPVRGQPGTPETDRLIALLAGRATAIDPTQAWGELLGRPETMPAEELEPGMACAPYSIAANYRSVINRPRASASDNAPRGPSMLKVLRDKGVPIIAGTDGALPGYSLIREVELYVRAGFTPLQALQSATSVPAKALGLDEELGTVTAGKRADLVVLDADPLADISALRRTRFVVAGGRMYEPGPLWTLASFRPRDEMR
jgi:imidazolonepropionase-like amidohydrolase